VAAPTTEHRGTDPAPHGSARPHAGGHGPDPRNAEPGQRGPWGQEGTEHDDGAAIACTLPCARRPAHSTPKAGATDDQAGRGLKDISHSVGWANALTDLSMSRVSSGAFAHVTNLGVSSPVRHIASPHKGESMHKDSLICKPLGNPPIQIGAGTALEHFSFRLNLSAVIAGLDPAIHRSS
jgi:hypothetical protein